MLRLLISVRKEQSNLLLPLQAITTACLLPPVVACNRSLTPQPFRSGLSFSLGDSADGSPVSPSGGLVGVFRSSVRLPAGSSASDISPLPEVLRGGRSVSVSRTLFWTFHCSADVHSCHGPDLIDHASFRLLDPEVPRRLASPRVLVPRDCSGEGLSPLAVSGAQHSCQPGQELPDSFTDPGLSWDEASDASFEGFPDPQTCPKALLSRLRVRLSFSSTSVSLASAVRGNVVAVDDCSGVSASDAIPSAPTPCPGTPLAERISGGPSNPTSSALRWVFRTHASLFLQTPRIPIGEPPSTKTTCPARGL